MTTENQTRIAQLEAELAEWKERAELYHRDWVKASNEALFYSTQLQLLKLDKSFLDFHDRIKGITST